MTASAVDSAALQAAAKRVLDQYETMDDPDTEEPIARAPNEALAAEWDEVNRFRDQLELDNANRSATGIRPVSNFTPIGYVEARNKLLEAAAVTTTSSSASVVGIQRYDFSKLSCASRLFYKIFGPPEFKRDHLRSERDAVFTMAATRLSADDQIHQRMLQSIYRKLTGQTEPCPSTGNHWEVIGFQGQDPATDLRGSGILGLLQILYFAKQAPALLSRVLTLSQDERQNFPFAIVSLNFTGICLKVLREARLYSICNARNSVIDTVCLLYLALFYDMYIGWKNHGKTIEKFPPTRDEIEKRARRDPKRIILAFEKQCDSQLHALISAEEFIPQ